MCDIYRNSILTIAASCSGSDCEGFLRERLIEEPVALAKPSRLQSVRLRQAVNHSRMLHEDPIHSRAWTFQEAILPRRLLSFGSHEATWECETLRQCECRQIEYETDTMTTHNELGRAAYRTYTRAVIPKALCHMEKYDFPNPGTHSLRSDARIAVPEIPLREHEARPSEPESSLITRYKRLLFKNASPIEGFRRRYLEQVRQRTMRDILRATEPTLSHGSSSLISLEHDYIVSGELSPGDASACAEWLENVFIKKEAVNAFYRYWRRVLIPEYTRRALSKDSDRLIALQAIASDISSGIPHDRYLAGLWEGDLINQLCWRSAAGQGLPADNESPSWSWSSIRGPVIPLMAEEGEKSSSKRGKMKVISADCSLAGHDPCGKILSGSIILKTAAMEVRYIRNKETGLFEFHAGASSSDLPELKVFGTLKIDFSPDTPLGCEFDGSLTRCAEWDVSSNRRSDHAMKATILLVKSDQGGNFCVLVCSRVSITCRRLGIGTIWNLALFTSHLFVRRFILI